MGRLDQGGGEGALTTPFDRRPGIEQLGLRLTRLARLSRRESSLGDGTNAKPDSRASRDNLPSAPGSDRHLPG